MKASVAAQELWMRKIREGQAEFEALLAEQGDAVLSRVTRPGNGKSIDCGTQHLRLGQTVTFITKDVKYIGTGQIESIIPDVGITLSPPISVEIGDMIICECPARDLSPEILKQVPTVATQFFA